jgi:hypothetical protein
MTALGALLLLGGCREGALLAGMASLDRTYVPALMLTEEPEGNTARAVMAVKELKQTWVTFLAVYGRALEDAPDWVAAAGRVEDHILKADDMAMLGRLDGANMALRKGRAALMEFRRGADLAYFPDLLAVYQPVMESIVATAGDGKLTAAETEAVRRALEDALHLWEEVRAAEFDARVFAFSEEKARRLRDHIEEEAASLVALDWALGHGDGVAAAKAARSLKPPFASAYGMFGSFGGFQGL